MSGLGTPLAAYRPTSPPDPLETRPQASRLKELAGSRIAVVRTMPPGSGVEPVAELVRYRLETLGAATDDIMRRDFMADDPDERAELARSFEGVVFVAGPTATTTGLTIRYAAELEILGTPSSVIYFENFAPTVAHALDRSRTNPAAVSIGLHRGPEDGPPVAHAISALTSNAEPVGPNTRTDPGTTLSKMVEADSYDILVENFHTLGYTDGLPVTLPTAERVEEMLSGTSLDKEHVVTSTFRPEARTVTVRDVAVNAVMAGARPQQLPVILAAASLMGLEIVDSMTRSVNSFTFAQYIGGPYALEAAVEGGLGALGTGNRANATIARALGLMIRNLGGAVAGVNTTPAQGNATQGLVFTDNPKHKTSAHTLGLEPWTALQTDFGFSDNESSLTLYAGGFYHFGNFYYGGFEEITDALAFPDLPSGALVLVTDKLAQRFITEGVSREDLQKRFHERIVRSMGEMRRSGFYPLREALTRRGAEAFGAWPQDYLDLPDDAVVPVYGRGTIQACVVGSDASALAQVWIMGKLGTANIDQFR